MKSLLKQFVGTAGLQFLSKGISVVSGVIFARFLGAEQYGLYTYVFSIVAIMGIPVLAGVPNLLVREIASFHLEKNWAFLKGVIRWSRAYVLIMATIMVFIVLMLIYGGYYDEHVAALLLIAVWSIPLRGIATQQDALLNGFRKPILAQIPSKLLAPLITIAILAYYIVTERPLTSMTLVNISITALIFTCVLSVFLVRKTIKNNAVEAKARYSVKVWQKALVPFSIMTFVVTLNAELAIVLLGWLSDHEAVAYFRVAMQAVMLISIVLSSVNAVLMPNIARFYQNDDLANSQTLLTRSVQLTVFVSLPIFLILVFWGDNLITFLFGAEYLSAYPALVVLCIGQLMNVMLGSAGLVLNMTRNENKTLRSLLISLTINVVLLAILIPLYGEIGAAFAVAISLCVSTLLMTIDVWRLTKLKTWLSIKNPKPIEAHVNY